MRTYKEIYKEIYKLEKNKESLYKQSGFESEYEYINALYEEEEENYFVIKGLKKEIKKYDDLIRPLYVELNNYSQNKIIDRAKIIIQYDKFFDGFNFLNFSIGSRTSYLTTSISNSNIYRGLNSSCCDKDLNLNIYNNNKKQKLIINDFNGNILKVYIDKSNEKIRKEFLNKDNEIYTDIYLHSLSYNDFIYIIDNNIDFVFNCDEYPFYLRIIFNEEYYKLMEY